MEVWLTSDCKNLGIFNFGLASLFSVGALNNSAWKRKKNTVCALLTNAIKGGKIELPN